MCCSVFVFKHCVLVTICEMVHYANELCFKKKSTITFVLIFFYIFIKIFQHQSSWFLQHCLWL